MITYQMTTRFNKPSVHYRVSYYFNTDKLGLDWEVQQLEAYDRVICQVLHCDDMELIYLDKNWDSYDRYYIEKFLNNNIENVPYVSKNLN